MRDPGNVTATTTCGTVDVVRSSVRTPHPTCPLYNVSGTPAISLPVAESSTGLPIGIQFGAADFREDLLISLAAQVEDAVRWERRSPRHHVRATYEESSGPSDERLNSNGINSPRRRAPHFARM